MTTGFSVCVTLANEITFGEGMLPAGLKLKTQTELCFDTSHSWGYHHKVKCEPRSRTRGEVIEIEFPVTATFTFEEVRIYTATPRWWDPCGVGSASTLETVCQTTTATTVGTFREMQQIFSDEPCPPVTPDECVETHTFYPSQPIDTNGGGPDGGGLYLWIPSDIIRCP